MANVKAIKAAIAANAAYPNADPVETPRGMLRVFARVELVSPANPGETSSYVVCRTLTAERICCIGFEEATIRTRQWREANTGKGITPDLSVIGRFSVDL
jgi:hypothetical protein